MSKKKDDKERMKKAKSQIKEPRPANPFYLCQRLRLAPYARHKAAYPKAEVKSNPFGYGRMGDYELDYMGSAEFEFGAIPEANNRLAAAGRGLTLGTYAYNGFDLDFLWIADQGEPFAAFVNWAFGRYMKDDGTIVDNLKQGPFWGKEVPYELKERLDGKSAEEVNRHSGEWQTALWWGLDANVIFGFKEDGHMEKWIESMGSAPTEFLR